jgi:hypothetical protein
MSEKSGPAALWSGKDCIQCTAEEVLSVPIEELTAAVRQQLEDTPERRIAASIASMTKAAPPIASSFASALSDGIGMTILTDEVLEQAIRAGVRQTRVTCRTILLEPHECGKSE